MRRFLWSNGDCCRGKAKVAWEAVCLPKSEGGLGIRRLSEFNVALLSVHIWKLLSNKESLWDKVRYWENRTDVSQVCPLCDVQPDSHGHLFFRCSFSLKVWKGVCEFAKIESYSDVWGDILVKYESFASSKSADVVTAKLVLAASCYLIWQERNLRLFKNQRRDCSQIIDAVVGIVRLKLLSSRFRSSSRKWMEVWKLPNATLEV
ncbi:uncharacterized protein LOC143592167 [Bidens hawaiensis]|uniref:uncharacterized protein LOC143592167 n=1 Tax=Bidens hawaiensis TaxID=980011 RepID=UPI00404A1AFA